MGDILAGDCLSVLAGRRAEFEAVVSDPPSGIAFMGLKFDVDHGGQDRWIEYMAARFAAQREACIPGAYGLYWSLPRTQDWTMQAIRRAGWNIVDTIHHVFGQGWPKGRGQLKPAQEAWILCRDPRDKVRPLGIDGCRVRRSWAERSEAWFQSGHSAKPEAAKIAAPPGVGITVNEGGSWPPNWLLSHAPCCREVGSRKVKPTGGAQCGEARNEGGTRPSGFGAVGADRGTRSPVGPLYGAEEVPAFECLAACACGLSGLAPVGGAPTACPGCAEERWWACPVAELDGQSGESTSPGKTGRGAGGQHGRYSGIAAQGEVECPSDSGGASRFFPTFHYDAKASTRERQAGCESLLWIKDKAAPIGWRRLAIEELPGMAAEDVGHGNVHPTIKPIGAGQDDGLMRWLVRLVTPEQGPVLDGMCGTGSTLVASQIEGRDYLGCDIDPGAVDIARARTAFWTPERHRLELVNSAALRAEEKRQEEAAARGQLDWTRGL